MTPSESNDFLILNTSLLHQRSLASKMENSVTVTPDAIAVESEPIWNHLTQLCSIFLNRFIHLFESQNYKEGETQRERS